ncbi:MAG: hypothetical protein HY223_06860 [Thaumarchaeota archaeon]|nr:hypothetical protein [Nitrososphaerota archaeon]
MVRVDNAKIRRFFACFDLKSSTTEKGRQLEDAFCYIFEKIPGVSLEGRNVRNRSKIHEIDLIFWNDQARNGLYFLPPVIAVECKNWAKRVTGE